MKSHHLTLAVYGIQDVKNYSYPVYVHDHNMTLYQNGRIINHLALERHTRNKYDHRLPGYLYALLKQEKITGMKNLDLVFVDHVMGRSFISREGNIRFEGPLHGGLSEHPERGQAFFLDHHPTAYGVNHELAHIFSNLPFHGPFKENSLHVHFDGGASKSNFSAWLYQKDKIRPLEYHWDLQYLSSFFNANALTFSLVDANQKEQNSMPGKFMGYAAYGNYKKDIELWLSQYNYFQHIWGQKQSFFDRLKKDWNIILSHFDGKNPFLQDIAATFQHIFQRDLIKKLKTLQAGTGAEYLYYSGGSALNIKANTELIKSGIFRQVFIPPCTNDSGLSIGAGALVEWQKHGSIQRHSPYLNNWFLNNPDIRYTREDIIRLARLLAEGSVVAVANGAGESGPRALGNRSILARADSSELAQYISRKLKKREWYRPLAPVMLEKNLASFTNASGSRLLSKYMLTDFAILPEKAGELKGAVHVDGTSRIQTLEYRRENPFLYDLLHTLETQHGIKALLNTSFNSKGRPLVHTEEDALKEAREMGINQLVINGELKINP